MRRVGLLPMILLWGIAAGCDEPPSGKPTVIGTAAPQATASPGLSGGVVTTHPTPPPVTPSPTVPPAGPSATSVYVLPESPRLYLPAGPGTDPVIGLPTSVRLTAMITKSNGSTENEATWVSLSPEVMSVDETGLVTALAAGSGPGPWTVGIKATSRDGKVSAIRLVTLVDEGGVAVDIE